MARFQNREQAGRLLAAELRAYAGENPLVLALPRGGVPVAAEVARALHAPLDIWVVRKIGVPWHPEVGVGAVAEGGYTYLNHDILATIQMSEAELVRAVEDKRREVTERVTRLRQGRPRPALRDRTVIVVDDGIATGGTVRAAVRSIRNENPLAVVLATPVAAADVARSLVSEVDRFVSLRVPHDLYAIGLWYEDFSQVEDDVVLQLLQRAREEQGPGMPLATRHA